MSNQNFTKVEELLKKNPGMSKSQALKNLNIPTASYYNWIAKMKKTGSQPTQLATATHTATNQTAARVTSSKTTAFKNTDITVFENVKKIVSGLRGLGYNI